MAHHSEKPSRELFERLREQMGSHADTLGPTGHYPEGKLVKEDEGELKLAVGSHRGKVFLEFGKSIDWIGFNPQQACDLASSLVKWAKDARKHPKSPEKKEPLTVEI